MAQTANAASLLVDDDGQQCPAATHDSIQAAIDAAVAFDTIVVCEGTYSEGSGLEGTNGLTITKSLSIKGAGADKVTIQPTRATPAGGQIAAASPELRDGVGNIVSVNGTPEAPLEVDISGVTISGGGDKTYFDPDANPPIWNGEFENGVYAEAGLVFLDAGGSFKNSRITNVVVSERPGDAAVPGAYRYGTLGWGLAKVTSATSAPSAASLPLDIAGSRFDRYNRGGILIDGATNDMTPLTASGNPQEAEITRSTVVGRNLNSPPLDGSGGGALLTSGVEFGQDGIRVTSGSSLDLNASDIFQNLPAGAGTNVIGKLNIAAGLRFIDAGASRANNSNILQNGYGIINVEADGTTPNTATPVEAYNNWWGLAQTSGIVNTGPGVSPATLPAKPNNPVNGSVDANFGSDAVHFKDVANGIGFRAGNEADTDGIWPTAETPAPTVDAPPTIGLSSDVGLVAPGGEVTLTADAEDDFGIRKVTFMQGATDLGSVVPPANSITWTAPDACGAPGTVTFTAYAEDSDGQESAADVSVDVDDCAPVVELTAEPAASPLGAIKLSADASDDLGLSSLEFSADGQVIHTVNDPANGITEYTFVPEDPCGAGENFQFSVVATDNTGHEATAETLFQRDDCAPSVELESDLPEVAPGGTVNLTATAEDDDVVTTLAYAAGDTAIGTSNNTNGDNPWVDTRSWDAPDVCGTSTVITVTAEDSAGQESTDTVTVTTTPCPDTPPVVELSADPTSVDPGGQVTLTATATDDDEVVSLTFFEGANQIGSVTPPNDSITWTAPDACNESYMLRVVAEDSAGQTAEAAVNVTTNACPPPAEPAVDLKSPKRIAQNGTTVTAKASSGADLGKVTFFLGTRRVCEDTAAPFSCRILPNGRDIGGNSVRAVVTDSLGRTAEDLESVTVTRFKPKKLRLNSKRIGGRKVRIRVSGRLVMPARLAAAEGCKASRVDVKARLGKRTLVNKQVALGRKCTYGVAFGAPRTKKKRRVVISVRFPGNAKLTATNATRKVR